MIFSMELQELLIMLGEGMDDMIVGRMGFLHIFSDWNECLEPFMAISVG
jgi:hypothetical protein